MNWKDVEAVYAATVEDLGGRIDPEPKHTGPIVGGIGQPPDQGNESAYIKAPPVVSCEFDIETFGPRARIEITGSGVRSVRSRPTSDSALGTTLVPVQIAQRDLMVQEGTQDTELIRIAPKKTKNDGAKGYKTIDYGLTIVASMAVSKNETDGYSARVMFTNATGGTPRGRKHTTFHDFRFKLNLAECRIIIPKVVSKREDVPMYIETTNAAAYPSEDLTSIELSPLGLWDQRRITPIRGPTFAESQAAPFDTAISLGRWSQDFAFAAKIAAKATERVVHSDRYYKFQYFIRGRIYQAMVKSWDDGIHRAIIDNAPTASGKSEPNYDAATVASIVMKRKSKDQDVGTVAIITEPIRTLASEQLERLFRFLAYANEQLPDSMKLSMGFYMGTQEGRGIPRDPSADVKIDQVPITNCPFCESELLLDFDAKSRRLVPKCIVCTPHRTFPWIYLTISETEQFLPNIVVATLDKLCYEEGRNLSVHSFFGRDFVRCPGCLRGWAVTARIIKGGATCWVCNEPLTMNDVRKSAFSVLIMDEAHAFRGSMGSYAGLYTSTELALAKQATKRVPFVIASTATIKRAPDLMRNLAGTREAEVIPATGDEDVLYFKKSQEMHRRFTFLCPNVSNRVAIPKAVASVKKAWDTHRRTHPEEKLPDKLPQVVFTKKRQNAENLRNAILALGDEDALGIVSEVIHGESTKREIKQRLKEIASNEIDVLFVTIDLISLGLDIPSIQAIHFDGMPEDYAKFVQAYGRAARNEGTSGLIFIWLRMNMPGEAYYLEHFRDLFLYKRDLMPVIPINKWFPQAIKSYVIPAALQYSFYTDQRGSIFSPAVASRRFSDTTFLKELEDFIVGDSLANSLNPEDAEIARKYTRLGTQDLSSFVQNTPTSGKTSVQAFLDSKLPRGIRSQSGQAEVIPTNFSKELMSVRVERSLTSAGYSQAELGLEEK